MGLTQLTGSLNIFKVALAATGIGAIVVLLGSLATFLNSTQSGLDKSAQQTAKFQKSLEPLIKALASVGEILFKIIESAVEVFSSLINIATPAINIITNGFKFVAEVISNTTQIVSKFFNSIIGNSSTASNLAATYVSQLQQIEKLLKQQEVENSKSLATQEQLKNIRDNELNDIRERQKANEKLGKIIEKQLQDNLKLENEKLAIFQKQLANKPKELRTNEDIAKIQEQQKKINEIIADIEGKRNEQITNRVSLIKEEFEIQNRLQDAELRLAKARDKNFEFTQKSLNKEIDLIKQKRDSELKFEKDARKRKAIELESEAEIFEKKRDFSEKVKSKNEELVGKQIELANKNLDKQIFTLERLALREKELTEGRFIFQRRILELNAQKEINDAKNNAEQILLIRAKLQKDIEDLQKETTTKTAETLLQQQLSQQNTLQAQLTENTQEFFDNQAKIIETNANLEVLANQDNADKIVEIFAKRDKELSILENERTKQRLENEINTQQTILNVVRQGSEEYLKAQQQLVKLQEELALVGVDNFEQIAVTQAEAQKQILENENAFRQKYIELIGQYGFERVKLENEQELARAFSKQELDRFQIQSEINKVQAIGGIAAGFGQIFGQQSAIAKTTASVQAGINSFLAFTQALADPTVPTFLKIFTAGGILASGLAQQAKILGSDTSGAEQASQGIQGITAGLSTLTPPLPIPTTPQIPKFRDGGLVRGAGTGTSDSIFAKISNGESVINANSTKMFAPLLSQINVAGGGKAFASGGIATNGSISKIKNNFDITQALTNAVKTLPTPVVSVVDIQKVSDKVQVRDTFNSL